MAMVLLKGGKAAQIGEERTFGGKPYVKTANGWRPKPSGRQKADKPTTKHYLGSPDHHRKYDKKSDDEETDSIQDQVDEKLKNDIAQVLQHPHHNQTQKVQKLLQLGIVDRKHIAALTGANYSRVYQLAKQHEAQGGNQEQQPQQSVGLSKPGGTEDIEQKQADQKAVVSKLKDEGKVEIPQPTVDERWDAYDVFTDMFATGVSKSLVAFGQGGAGKALRMSELVLTTTGWKQNKDLKLGELLMTPSGRIAPIVGIYPQEPRQLYKVTLKDGRSFECCDEHLHSVWDKTPFWDNNKEGKNKTSSAGRRFVLSTQQILDRGIVLREESYSTRGNRISKEYRFAIPNLPVPVQFPTQELPIDPYLLGFLIADGSFATAGWIGFACDPKRSDEITKQIGSKIDLDKYKLVQTADERGINWLITTHKAEDNQIAKGIESLGLRGKNSFTKFIPDQYMIGDVNQRLELLKGLMDGDGYVDERGLCTYYTSNEQLSKQVYQLALSFGLSASIQYQTRQASGFNLSKATREGQTHVNNWAVTFRLPPGYEPCTLSFKLDRYRKRAESLKKSPYRGESIVSIVPTTVDVSQCIAIDDPEHLFIIGDFITTHNTYTWTQTAKRNGLQEYNEDEGSDINEGNYDYVKITGKATPAAIYQALWEHNGKKIVFDDCDSALEDDDAVNLFKGALDTSGDGTIAWGSQRPIKSKKFNPKDLEPDKEGRYTVPGRFKFTGQVMFISNLPVSKMPQPLVDSRAIAVDLSMNPKQTIERMGKIIHKMPIEDASGNEIATTHEEREEALDFLGKYAESIRPEKLNARTLGNIIKIQQSSKNSGRDWKRLALVTLSN